MNEINRIKKNKRKNGFTIIELIMVLLVMTLLAVLLSSLAQQGIRAFGKAKQEAESIRSVTLTFEMIRRDLLGALYLDPVTGSAMLYKDSIGNMVSVNFTGIDTTTSAQPDDQLRFFAWLSPEASQRGDFTIINYKRRTVSGVTQLSRASRALGGGSLALDLSSVSETFEPLLFNVTGFSVEYLKDATGTFQTALTSSDPLAFDAQKEGNVPKAVRIKVTQRNTNGKEQTYTQTVVLAMN